MNFGPILWTPPVEGLQSLRLTEFISYLTKKYSLTFGKYEDLHNWSVQQRDLFWSSLFSFFNIRADKTNSRIVFRSDKHQLRGQWFPEVRLNYAENLLTLPAELGSVSFLGEDKVSKAFNPKDILQHVTAVAAWFGKVNIDAGDRVAAFVPNLPETLFSMLATASLGAVWTSCSPDFGVAAAGERFEQVAPKILVAADGYYYKGKLIDSLERISQLVEHLPSVEQILIIPYTKPNLSLENLPANVRKRSTIYSALDFNSGGTLRYVRRPFNAPLFILYSSGTTGKPKCIIHSIGGTLLEHLKELVLHTNITEKDTLFYQTTCGWMMWNWMASALATGSNLVLYDGAPLYKEGRILWDLIDSHRITVFGSNAKYLSSIEKEGLIPRDTHKLDSLRLILSTGSPLYPEQFDYVYSKIKPSVQLSSISGGTDIVGCFALGSPISPVIRGELQVPSLGMDVRIFDANGKNIEGLAGELVCASPFPSMPSGFWNDVDGSRYAAAYFERFPGVWHHGDFAERRPSGGFVIHGRSDAVLNPGGIRIGTAEIYRQVEKVPNILESVAVGYTVDNDEKVVLFVRLRQDEKLTSDLEKEIRKTIRENLSPHHVPWKIVQAPDFPRTRNNKLAELAVRDTLKGIQIKNRDALANPEALDYFTDLNLGGVD